MATAYKVQIPASDTGLLKFKQDEATAQKVSELLQHDLEKHHVFFNASGFHDHIVHQLLSLYGTGASAQALQKAFDENSAYMIPAQATHSSVLEELRADWKTAAPKYFSKGKHFPDFFAFFQEEIEKKGYERVLLEYVFKGDEMAEVVYARLFAGVLHPIIQLLYGLEWSQPAIIASALAQTCVHENNLQEFLTKAEKLARTNDAIPTPLLTMYEEVIKPEHEKLARSAKHTDEQRIFEGVFARAPEEAAQFVSRIKVDADKLEERTAEMVHVNAFIAAATAWNPPHVPKYDFFMIHHLNTSPIFLTINKYSWLSHEWKVRILEWKLRFDMIQYIARNCPKLDSSILSTYMPKDGKLASDPRDLLPRFHDLTDDGHIIKVARSLMIAREVSKGYEDREWYVIKDEDYVRMVHMLLDGVNEDGGVWARSAGFEEAWQDIPNITWKGRL